MTAEKSKPEIVPPLAGKPRIVRAVHANQGIRFRYQRQLLALTEEMGSSIEYWITAQYRETPPALAADATPSKEMQRKFNQLSRRWLKRFDEAAPKIAEAYLKGSFRASDSAMRMALKDAGFTVQFQMTAGMQDAFNASLAENIGLIKSIPEQYLQKVEGVIMRGYASGRDLQTMVKQLRKLYPEASDRAVLIARDQSNKANAVVINARQLELGIVEAIWTHSNGGKIPRPDHVAASGKRYKVSEGCLISGEYILPGQKINCRCVSRSVLPSLVA